MAERRWFYELLTEEFGPVSTEQISDLLSDRTLSGTDRVRAEDSSAWITVAEMQTQSVAAAANAEEITDLSELSFSFEDSSATIDTIPNQPDIDSFCVEGDSDSPLPQHTDTETEDEEQEEVYFVESFGQVLGPMPLPELILMADNHVLSASDKVREGEFGSWQAVDDMPELAAALINFNNDDVETPAESDSAAPEETAPQETAPEHTTEISNSMEDTLSDADTDQVQPTAAKARSAALPPKQAKSRKPKKKKRRPKRPQIDELEDDDFAAVFSEPPSAGSSAPTPQSAEPAASAPAALSEPAVQQEATGAASTQSASMPSYTPPTPPAGFAQASAAAAASMRPTHAPPSSSKRKPSRGAGFSFEMPEPRVMGIVGGILGVILLIVAGVGGYIPMPGMATDPVAVLAEFSGEYKQLAAGTISEDQWKEFQARARPSIVAANKHYMGIADLSADEFQTRIALGKLGALVSIPADEPERQAEAYLALKQAMAGL